MLFGALNQTAVYWGSPSKDGFGKLTFATPIEVAVRWEEKQELFVDSVGKEQLSQAIIYADLDMEPDGYLYLGYLIDLSTEEKANPMLKSTTYPIKRFNKTVDVGGSIFVRKVWL